MRKPPDGYVAGLARRRALLARKHAIAAHALAKASGGAPASTMPPGLAMRQGRITAWVCSVRPEWAERRVAAEVALAMNGVGVFALPKPDSASRGPRAAFPARRMHDHLMVGVPYEPEAGPPVRWRDIDALLAPAVAREAKGRR